MYVRPDKAIRENIIVKMEEDRDAVQQAFQVATHIEHDVDFNDHLVPAPPEIRSRVALSDLTPVIGAVVSQAVAGPGASLDVVLNGVGSILVAPAPLLPGPVPLLFVPGTIIPAGSVIDFVLTDGGVIVEKVCCNVQYVKNISTIWEPPI